MKGMMSVKNRIKQGSATVEAVLLIPLIFLGIVGIIYLSIIHYQNISTVGAAMQSANRISIAWPYIGSASPSILKEVDSAEKMLSRSDFIIHDPYRFIIDSKKSKREENSKNYAYRLANKVPKFYTTEQDNSEITVKKTGFLLSQYVEVSTNKSYINPLGKAMEKIGISEKETNIVTAKAKLTSPTEFIRNVEFIRKLVQLNKDN